MAVLACVRAAAPGLSAPVSQRIEQERAQLERVKQREGVLTTTIRRYSTRIASLQGEIGATREQLGRAQESFDRQKAELLEVRNRLEGARDRLESLRRELATAREVLAARDAMGRLHAGVDIPGPGGTPIRGGATGRVTLMGWAGGYGNYTRIQHTGSLSTWLRAPVELLDLE
ncbi:MAG TPA: peptidoglycan DD-metalloendopeptidase family protein [Thermoleophilaceae bacterium]|nr:peptidoglycan DD-metalloendopeptidase family protein [Thermoleophilaceae bacterium]